MRSTFHNPALLRVVFVASGALVLGASACDSIDWREVVEGVTRPGGRPQPEPSPCAAILCPVDTVCEVRDVVCVKEPCPPVVQCVPAKAPPPPVPGGCAAILCPTDTVCVEEDVACVNRQPCPRNVKCVPRTPPTVPPGCAAILCPVNTTCEERKVECVRAPCPPSGVECVPIPTTPSSPCDLVRCARGTHCEAKQVTCVRAPCPPVAECVPDRMN